MQLAIDLSRLISNVLYEGMNTNPNWMKTNVITRDFVWWQQLAVPCWTKTNLYHRLDRIITVFVICVWLAVEFSCQSESFSEGMNTNQISNKNLFHNWYLFLVTTEQNKILACLNGIKVLRQCVSLYKSKNCCSALSLQRACSGDMCDLASHRQHKHPNSISNKNLFQKWYLSWWQWKNVKSNWTMRQNNSSGIIWRWPTISILLKMNTVSLFCK